MTTLKSGVKLKPGIKLKTATKQKPYPVKQKMFAAKPSRKA